MKQLSSDQKQLLFDYCIGLTSQEQISKAEQLISSNKEAAEIYSRLKASIEPLDSIAAEPCPETLAESTISRLNNLVESQARLEQLLTAEQTKKVTTKSQFWRNFGLRLATAAVFMIVGTVLITVWNISTEVFRQKSWQNRCQMQLGQIFQGINNYSSDYNGKLPAVPTTAGAPWWKVGNHQSKENHSNTRHMWLLARDGYASPADFVCPGKIQGRSVQVDTRQIKNYYDFPDRRYVNYSFRIRCNKTTDNCSPHQMPLIADLNPIFEILPQCSSDQLKLKLDKNLSNFNSNNHNRRGQNVLFGDGRIRFIKKRFVGIARDDIYTLQNTIEYQGIEIPVSDLDAFLAP